MLQHFLVFEKLYPWLRTVNGLCRLWLAILSGLKDLNFEWREQWNIFVLPLHRIFRLINADQLWGFKCSRKQDIK